MATKKNPDVIRITLKTDLSKLTRPQLLAYCQKKKFGDCKSNSKKDDLVDIIDKKRKLQKKKRDKKKAETITVRVSPPKKAPAKKTAAKKPSPAKKAPSPKKLSPAKKAATKKAATKKAASPPKRTLTVDCGPCEKADKFCDVSDGGKCVAKTSKNLPWGEKKFQEKYGSEYEMDVARRILGLRNDIRGYGGVGGPSEKVVAKRVAGLKPVPVKGSCAETPTLCTADQLCNATSGRCIKNTAVNRKGKFVLEVQGRMIVGSEETLLMLQGKMGGVLKNPEGKTVGGEGSAKRRQVAVDEEKEVSGSEDDEDVIPVKGRSAERRPVVEREVERERKVEREREPSRQVVRQTDDQRNKEIVAAFAQCLAGLQKKK